MDVIPTGDLMEWMFDFTKPWETTQTVDEQASGQGDVRVLAEAEAETETEKENSSEVETDTATVLEIPERF